MFPNRGDIHKIDNATCFNLRTRNCTSRGRKQSMTLVWESESGHGLPVSLRGRSPTESEEWGRTGPISGASVPDQRTWRLRHLGNAEHVTTLLASLLLLGGVLLRLLEAKPWAKLSGVRRCARNITPASLHPLLHPRRALRHPEPSETRGDICPGMEWLPRCCVP